MITREDLLRSSEYWTGIIQNKIYNDFVEFIEEKNIPQKQLAQSLGLSKGRISQILSGDNLNFRLETIVKLCLTINKIPRFQLLDLEEYIANDREPGMRMSYKSEMISVDNMQTYKPVENSDFFTLPSSNISEYEPIGTGGTEPTDTRTDWDTSKIA